MLMYSGYVDVGRLYCDGFEVCFSVLPMLPVSACVCPCVCVCDGQCIPCMRFVGQVIVSSNLLHPAYLPTSPPPLKRHAHKRECSFGMSLGVRRACADGRPCVHRQYVHRRCGCDFVCRCSKRQFFAQGADPSL